MALVAEGAKKAGLLWITCSPGARPRAAWHIWWVDALGQGHVLLVCDGLEQPLGDLVDGATVEVTVPSKDNRARLVTFTATATELRPAGASRADWIPAAAALHAQRLNPPDGEDQPARWERESRIVRLTPTGEVREAPGRMPEASGAAEAPPSPATTRGELPFVLGRATGRPPKDPAGSGTRRRRRRAREPGTETGPG